jgi:hypothetical protein
LVLRDVLRVVQDLRAHIARRYRGFVTRVWPKMDSLGLGGRRRETYGVGVSEASLLVAICETRGVGGGQTPFALAHVPEFGPTS